MSHLHFYSREGWRKSLAGDVSSLPESSSQTSTHTFHTKHTHHLKRTNQSSSNSSSILAQSPGFLNNILNIPSRVYVTSFSLATYINKISPSYRWIKTNLDGVMCLGHGWQNQASYLVTLTPEPMLFPLCRSTSLQGVPELVWAVTLELASYWG